MLGAGGPAQPIPQPFIGAALHGLKAGTKHDKNKLQSCVTFTFRMGPVQIKIPPSIFYCPLDLQGCSIIELCRFHFSSLLNPSWQLPNPSVTA